VLLSLAEWAALPVRVDLSGLSFADSAGLEPLVESTRRRRAASGPPLRISAVGRAAGRILSLLGVSTEPEIDVDAWDAADGDGIRVAVRGSLVQQTFPGPPGTRRRAAAPFTGVT